MADTRRVPLRDDALVVRFGLMRVRDLGVACERCYALRGLYGLSFFGENDLTLEEIVAAGGAPHRWVRCTQYGI